MSIESTKTQIIPVTIDKSHIVTIGERLYNEKTSFIRELVNNAYDADATQVFVEISPFKISVQDDGNGMDEDGLRQYFTIGSKHKKENDISPRFKRTRIGEFGIGKFSALSVCSSFEIETQKDKYRARLIFDKDLWAQHEDWHLNIDILSYDPNRGNGTVVTLHELSIQFVPGMVRRYLAEHSPIHIQNFKVYVNKEQVTDDLVAGRQVLVKVKTPFGYITGTLVIVPADRRTPTTGIAVQVKGVTIRRETFDMERSRKNGIMRITGKINADFVPITSSRDDFMRDSDEFMILNEAMKQECIKALSLIRDEADRKANLQASRVLKDALSKIGKAVKIRKDLFPDTAVPMGTAVEKGKETQGVQGYEVSQATLVPSGEKLDPEIIERLKKQGKKSKSKVILGSKSVIRNMKIANIDIAVRLEHLGQEEESVIAGGVIYVNLDHPLYSTYQNNDELLTLHISRILTKELALKAGIHNAGEAFALQSELLTDAFKQRGTKK